MPVPFTSHWLDFTPSGNPGRTDTTDRRDVAETSVSSVSPLAVEPCAPRTPIELVGDLAEAIHTHCVTCRVCRPEPFTSDTRPSLCPAGTTLWRAYREARRGLNAP